jgi:hypothetical protein
LQNIVQNEEESGAAKGEQELHEKYLKAKWDWKVDHTLGGYNIYIEDNKNKFDHAE